MSNVGIDLSHSFFFPLQVKLPGIYSSQQDLIHYFSHRPWAFFVKVILFGRKRYQESHSQAEDYTIQRSSYVSQILSQKVLINK